MRLVFCKQCLKGQFKMFSRLPVVNIDVKVIPLFIVEQGYVVTPAQRTALLSQQSTCTM